VGAYPPPSIFVDMVEQQTTVKKTTTENSGRTWGSERGEDKVEHSEHTNPITGKHTEKTVEKHTDE
jgi:hypothetical protein